MPNDVRGATLLLLGGQALVEGGFTHVQAQEERLRPRYRSSADTEVAGDRGGGDRRRRPYYGRSGCSVDGCARSAGRAGGPGAAAAISKTFSAASSARRVWAATSAKRSPAILR